MNKLILIILFSFLLLIPFENIISVYAANSETVLKIDSLSGFHRVGQEIIIKGTLKSTDDYSVNGAKILIKTNSNMNESGVIASDITDARGQFFIRTVVGNWGENIDVYAVFLGNTNTIQH